MDGQTEGNHFIDRILLRNPAKKLSTGGVQIIGRNSRFIGYFAIKTKKNTEKIPEDSRLTQALSDSILFVSKFKV